MTRTKCCTKCFEVKLVSEFNKRGEKGNSRLRSHCKSCNYTYESTLKAKKKVHYKGQNDKYNVKNASKRAQYYKDNKLKFRVAKYGITEEDYNQMVEAQGNSCKVCYRYFEEVDRLSTPHIDHDHETGKVRGLLCLHCNSALGQLEDDEDIIESLLMYIRGAS